jgi:hypothetical protein|tara:strand:+ start:794 stop:1483 length:690 start_codon:yes stop_codon:yes gene_type:complete
MANAQTSGYGFRSVMAIGSTPATQGQSEYQLYDTDGGAFNTFYKNDPVSLNDGNSVAAEAGFLQDAGYATTDDGRAGGNSYDSTGTSPKLVGIFNGAYYVDSTTSKPTWVNSLASGANFGTDYNTGSSNGIAFVIDNPNQEFQVRSGAVATTTTFTQADIGNRYNCSNQGGTGTSGQSDVRLDVDTADAAGNMFTLIRVAGEPNQTDKTDVNGGVDVVVAINPASSLYK